MKYNGIQEPEYKRVTSLLAQLLDLGSDAEQRVSGYIKNFGIYHFLNNLEAFSLASNDLEKLQALNLLLKSFISENDGNEKQV